MLHPELRPSLTVFDGVERATEGNGRVIIKAAKFENKSLTEPRACRESHLVFKLLFVMGNGGTLKIMLGA